MAGKKCTLPFPSFFPPVMKNRVFSPCAIVKPRLQVNHLSTSLLCLRLLPHLLRTAAQHPGTTPRLTVVTSEGHYWVDVDDLLPNTDASMIKRLNDPSYVVGSALRSQYQRTKRA
jgi:hypothetical protein